MNTKSVKFEELMSKRGVTDFSLCQDQYCNEEVQFAWEMFVEGFRFNDKQQNIIGKFVPNKSNPNKAFDVISKKPVDSTHGSGFEGVQVNGKTYHVYNEYWSFVPA